MKNQVLAVALGVMTALGVGCGGTEASPESEPQVAPQSDDTVTELGNGCPHNPFSCVKHCQAQGKMGKCEGTQNKVCTCWGK